MAFGESTLDRHFWYFTAFDSWAAFSLHSLLLEASGKDLGYDVVYVLWNTIRFLCKVASDGKNRPFCLRNARPTTQPTLLFPDYGLIIINVYIKNSLFSGICNWKNVNLLRRDDEISWRSCVKFVIRIRKPEENHTLGKASRGSQPRLYMSFLQSLLLSLSQSIS